jgi:hypothetical protein
MPRSGGEKGALESECLGSFPMSSTSQRIWGWGLPPEEASVEKRAHLADRVLQAALHARDLAPLSGHAQYYVAQGYFATCDADRVRIEAEKAAALNPYNAGMLGPLGLSVAITGHWDEGSYGQNKQV